MSLINDALKKANQQGRPNGSGQSPAVGLRPVPDHGKSAGGPFRAVVAVLASLMVLAAGWFIWNALKAANDQPPASQSEPAKEPRKAGAKPEPAKAIGPQDAAASPSSPSRVDASTNRVVRRPDAAPVPAAETPASAASVPATTPANDSAAKPPETAAAASVPGPAALAVWPEIKLQAIFYRLSKSSARVNGRVVSVGDMVGTAKVSAIERDRVEFELGGEKKTIQVLKGR